MRGGDKRREGMFSYVRAEQRVPQDHPLRPIREIVDRTRQALTPQFAKLYSLPGPAIDPAREAIAGAVTAGLLHSALGAPAHGAARIQSAVPLVRRPVDGCAGVGPERVRQKPGAVDRR